MGFGSSLKKHLYESSRSCSEQNAPQVLFSSLRGKTLGVDLSVVLHASMFSSYTTPEFAVDSDVVELRRGDVSKYLNRWYRQHNFVELGIQLIFVMDGFRDEAKEKNVREKRKSRIMKPAKIRKLRRNIQKDDNVVDDSTLNDMRRSVTLTTRMIYEAVTWAKCHDGVSVMFAPAQADPQLVRLELDGVTHGTISVDTDIFGHGSMCFIKGLCTLRKCTKPCILTPETYFSAEFRSRFGSNVKHRERCVARFAARLKSDYKTSGMYYSHIKCIHSIEHVALCSLNFLNT